MKPTPGQLEVMAQLLEAELAEREARIIKEAMRAIDDGDLTPERAQEIMLKIHAGRDLGSQLQRKSRQQAARKA